MSSSKSFRSFYVEIERVDSSKPYLSLSVIEAFNPEPNENRRLVNCFVREEELLAPITNFEISNRIKISDLEFLKSYAKAFPKNYINSIYAIVNDFPRLETNELA